MDDAGGATRRAWVEVDVGALRRNAEALAAEVSPAGLLPMVKADGYGLGALRVVEALRPVNPWGFGVASVDEGAALRAAGVGERLLVFSACGPRDAAALLESSLEPVVTSLEALRAYAAEATRADTVLPIHLEIDTGIGRAGLPHAAVADWLPDVADVLRRGSLRLDSTLSHLHSAERPDGGAEGQWESYREVLARLEAAGVACGALHIANSAATLRFPAYRADIVRPGLFLYGGGRGTVSLEPGGQHNTVSREPVGGRGSTRPEPVVSLRARVLDVREVPAESSVSYGATYVTRRPSRLATLGIGYGDGLPHRLSNRGSALLGGRRVPVRGAICMDVTVVDVTDLDAVSSGAVATLLGADGGEEIALAELAEACGAIEYEILTGLGPRLPRVTTRSAAGPSADPACHRKETGAGIRT